jgi:hypothetical protein
MIVYFVLAMFAAGFMELVAQENPQWRAFTPEQCARLSAGQCPEPQGDSDAE